MSKALDERTVGTTQRWWAGGLWLINLALVADLLVRRFLLKQELGQYLDIALIWLGTMLFTTLGMTASGAAPYGGKWSTSLWGVLILAVLIPVIGALTGMIHTPAAFIWHMVAAAAGAFVAVIVLRGIYGLWERRTLGRSDQL